MAIEINVPRLGWSMEAGIFREWLVAQGATVRPGEALFILESDKAAQEIESFDSGILAIPDGAPAAGDTVAVGQLLGYLLAEGETAPEYRTPRPAQPAPPPHPQKPPPAAAPDAPRQPARRDQRIPVTPRARRTARQLGIDVEVDRVQGTGRGGRIRERDILDSARTLRTPESGTLTFMTARARASAFDALVAEIDPHKDGGYSRGDLMRRLIAVALHAHPKMNAGDAIEIGTSFGLIDFSGRRIEHWAPQLPPAGIAALGVGRVTGEPLEVPLNLSFDASQIAFEEAASFLDFLCDLIESPVPGLVGQVQSRAPDPPHHPDTNPNPS